MRTEDTGAAGLDLRHHGDAEVRDDGAELVDLAVNVRADTPPAWLREEIAGSLSSLAAYPDGRAARAAVAARHGLPVERVLLTAGAAEAFVLLARASKVRRPVVVHPQFTEPEAALRDAGHTVERVLLREEDGFRLDPAAVPEEADLVVIGNPTNPTSVLHPAETVERLARPGRTLVVDEAFMDAVPGERAALAGRTDVPGLVVLRSLTKTWGAGRAAHRVRAGRARGDRRAGAGAAAVAGVHAGAGRGPGVCGAAGAGRGGARGAPHLRGPGVSGGRAGVVRRPGGTGGGARGGAVRADPGAGRGRGTAAVCATSATRCGVGTRFRGSVRSGYGWPCGTARR
ncbi:hypothetical protein GCM10017687_17810 [Streptomyces echinatus]